MRKRAAKKRILLPDPKFNDQLVTRFVNNLMWTGKKSVAMLDFGIPFAGSENWDSCIVKPEQECANPKPSAWTKSEVHTVITDSFKKRVGPAGDYFAKRIFPGPVMNATLAYMADQQATGEDAAIEFLTKHADVWTNWVSADVAKKVKAGL